MVVSVNQMSSNHKSDALFMTLLFFFAWRRLDKIKVNELIRQKVWRQNSSSRRRTLISILTYTRCNHEGIFHSSGLWSQEILRFSIHSTLPQGAIFWPIPGVNMRASFTVLGSYHRGPSFLHLQYPIKRVHWRTLKLADSKTMCSLTFYLAFLTYMYNLNIKDFKGWPKCIRKCYFTILFCCCCSYRQLPSFTTPPNFFFKNICGD